MSSIVSPSPPSNVEVPIAPLLACRSTPHLDAGVVGDKALCVRTALQPTVSGRGAQALCHTYWLLQLAVPVDYVVRDVTPPSPALHADGRLSPTSLPRLYVLPIRFAGI